MSRDCRRRRRLRAVLLLTTLLGGCLPHVLHGPRVEPGTTGALSGSGGYLLAAGDDRDALFGASLYGGVRRGWVSADDRAALLAGVQASPFVLLAPLFGDDPGDLAEIVLGTSYLDIYAQPPGTRGERWDAGLGALASKAVLAPYVQFGAGRSETQGWYSTQQLVISREPLADATFWLPSVGWRDRGRPQSRSAVAVDLTAAVPLQSERRDWFLFVTFTAELGLKPVPK